MKKRYSLSNFCRLFSSNHLKNDCIVSRFYNNIKKRCKIEKYRNKERINKFTGKGNDVNNKNVWIQACEPKMM